MSRLLDFLRKKPAQPEKQSMNLAFVLLPTVQMPDSQAILERFSAFEPGDQLALLPRDEGSPSDGDVLGFEPASGGRAFVALIPSAVPNREADEGARFSIGSFGTGWTLPPHCAHLIVTLASLPATPPAHGLSLFTSLLAAVAQASGAVGIYWGNAGATHGTEFFTTIAAEQGVTPRIMVWTGVSVARDPEGGLSLLSTGMRQLNLPDLLLTSRANEPSAVLETFFDLLSYVASRGEPIPDGDTVGRTADERFQVQYVASPVNPAERVWRVDIS